MDTLLRETPWKNRARRWGDEMMVEKDSARETGRCENCVHRVLSSRNRDTATGHTNDE